VLCIQRKARPAKELGFASKDNRIVITAGVPYGKSVSISLLKVEKAL
jgi:pyruvate kinase